MARTSAVVAGIQILMPYYKDPDGYYIAADHDKLSMKWTDRAVSDEDVAKLKELDWFQEDADEDEEGNSEYDSDYSWTIFV